MIDRSMSNNGVFKSMIQEFLFYLPTPLGHICILGQVTQNRIYLQGKDLSPKPEGPFSFTCVLRFQVFCASTCDMCGADKKRELELLEQLMVERQRQNRKRDSTYFSSSPPSTIFLITPHVSDVSGVIVLTSCVRLSVSQSQTYVLRRHMTHTDVCSL